MTELHALLEAVVAAPDDYAPRGVLADWLEERGDPRGIVVREAPNAWESLTGFPAHQWQVPVIVGWDKLIPANADGTGWRIFGAQNFPVTSNRRVVARINPPPGVPVEIVSIDAGGASTAVYAEFQIGDATVAAPSLAPHGYWRWVPHPDFAPCGIDKPIEIAARGEQDGTWMVAIVINEAEPRRPLPSPRSRWRFAAPLRRLLGLPT